MPEGMVARGSLRPPLFSAKLKPDPRSSTVSPATDKVSLRAGRLQDSLFPLLCCLLITSPVAVADTKAAQREAKAQELQQLRQRIGALRDDLNQVRTRHDALRDELRAAEQAIGRLSAAVHETGQRLVGQSRRLEELGGREARLRGSVAEQRRFLAQQVRMAYLMGRQETLKLLLSQEDPAAVGRMMTYYDYLNRARAERIAALLETFTQLQAVRQDIETETARLEAMRGEQQTQKAELERSQATRRTVLAELQKEMSDKEQRLQGLLRDEKELERLVAALAQVMADVTIDSGERRPFAQLKGKLSWPVKGRLVERFGAERMGKLRWQGVMIGAAEGQPVRAVSHGRVAFADWLRGYGYLLILDHGGGYMSLYGHNQSLAKEVGDWVEAGEVIAAVGASGGSERSALYFEIRRNGQPTDPVRWCRR